MIRTETFDRYLAILGLEREPPSFEFLRRLVRAQIMRVPFENISKLYLKKIRNAYTIPSLEEHIEGIEQFNFGGTCYANNPYFAELLIHLGFNLTMCGANMSKPDVHIVSLVRLGEREHLVDVGYGAPFFEPIPRDLDQVHEISFGRNRYQLHPQDEDGCSRMDHLKDDQLIHGYVVNPRPREIGYFAEVIRDSYSHAATFMNTVVIELFKPDRSIRIHNLTLTESTRTGATTKHLHDKEELAGALVTLCGFPSDIVREAIADVALEADIYS